MCVCASLPAVAGSSADGRRRRAPGCSLSSGGTANLPGSWQRGYALRTLISQLHDSPLLQPFIQSSATEHSRKEGPCSQKVRAEGPSLKSSAPHACMLLASTIALLGHSPSVPLFSHGEKGYPCIRTPAVIKTNASLLAFAGTRCGSGDGCHPHRVHQVDHMDTVMKRSTDGGHTWSNLQVVYSAACTDRDHGTPVYDETRNRVVLVFRGEDSLTWTMHSSDDGKTWSTPAQIPLGDYNQSRVSPGRGLQLRSTNPHAPNRLVFVAQFGTGKHTTGDVVYFSDDGGITWTLSPTIVTHGNEAQMVELLNGTLLMNARIEVPGEQQERLFASSDDGGATWRNFTMRDDLDGADQCMGSFLSVPGHGSHEQLLLYSHPAGATPPHLALIFYLCVAHGA